MNTSEGSGALKMSPSSVGCSIRCDMIRSSRAQLMPIPFRSRMTTSRFQDFVDGSAFADAYMCRHWPVASRRNNRACLKSGRTKHALGLGFVTRDATGHSVAHASLFIGKFAQQEWRRGGIRRVTSAADVVREGFVGTGECRAEYCRRVHVGAYAVGAALIVNLSHTPIEEIGHADQSLMRIINCP